MNNENINLGLKGRVRIQRRDTGEILYEQDNIIVNTVKSLFSRIMANSLEPRYGIWGLAIGSGDEGWGNNPPTATESQTALINETKRKQKSVIRFVDPITLDPVVGFSEALEIQTLFNATDDNITDPIREMGLIGGGSTSSVTNMSTASYWDPDVRDGNSVTLINYKTLPTLSLPASTDIIIVWILRF